MPSDIVQTYDDDTSLLARVDRAWFRVESVFNFVSAMVIMLLMFLAVAQVLGRKLINAPIYGYVDLVEFFMGIFAFLGIAYVQKVGAHIRMEIIIRRFKGRSLWSLEIFGTVIAIIVIGVLIEGSWAHFLRALGGDPSMNVFARMFEPAGDSSMNLDLPLWPSKLIVPVALVMLELRLLMQLYGFARLAYNPTLMPVAVPLMESVEETAAHEIEVSSDERDHSDSPKTAKADAD